MLYNNILISDHLVYILAAVEHIQQDNGVLGFPSQELYNDIPPLRPFNDTQFSLYFYVMCNFLLFFFFVNQITLEFLSIFSLHPEDTIALPPRVRVAPATWKSLALPRYLITRPHSFRHFCLYGRNLLIHICARARSVTFCHQSFIFSFLICRLVSCLVLYWHWLNKVGFFSLRIKDAWQDYAEMQMVPESWVENNCSSGTPRSRGNPHKCAAQATNVSLPWTVGPHHWGRATRCRAAQAEHSLDETSFSSGSAQQHLQPLPFVWPGDTRPPSHFLLYIPALPRKEQPFLQSLAEIPSGELLFEASFLWPALNSASRPAAPTR